MDPSSFKVLNLPKNFSICLMILLLFVVRTWTQHTWQQPLPSRSNSAVNYVLGPQSSTGLTKNLNIVLVWGDDCCHEVGYHEYEDVKNLFSGLLNKVTGVTVSSAFQYPSQQQWEAADLVVFYVHLDFLQANHYTQMDPFLARGGGMLFIHETVIQRPTGDALAQRCGLAWDEGASNWGVLPTPVSIKTQTNHDIIIRFPDSLDFVDEFYWNLVQGAKTLTVLGSSQSGPTEGTQGPPDPDQLDGKEWPIIWTYDNNPGKVFGTVLGHNLFTFNEPYFRTVLFRAMAWATGQPFEPFKPLVTDGLTLDNSVGCKDNSACNFDAAAQNSCTNCCVYANCPTSIENKKDLEQIIKFQKNKIHLSLTNGPIAISIYSLSGNKLFFTKSLTKKMIVDLSPKIFPSGVYHIQIQSDTDVYHEKFFIPF